MRLLRIVLIMVVLSVSTVAMAAPPKPVKAGPKDKCAVCGMFVAKYGDFAAQIHLRNGTVLHFDGPKDLFAFHLQPGKFKPQFSPNEVAAVYVTDYYSLTPIDATTGRFVVGSDVFGPMGKDLIPFGKAKDAEQFLKDHKGKNILTFRQVTPGVLKGLE